MRVKEARIGLSVPDWPHLEDPDVFDVLLYWADRQRKDKFPMSGVKARPLTPERKVEEVDEVQPKISTAIPDALRDCVVAMYSNGSKIEEIRSACGVSLRRLYRIVKEAGCDGHIGGRRSRVGNAGAKRGSKEDIPDTEPAASIK